MNRYKNLKCQCGKKATSANGKGKKCPSCGAMMATGDNWYLRYNYHGKNIVEACTSRLCDVETRMAELKLKLSSGNIPQREAGIKWADAVEDFEAYNKEHKLADSTQKWYCHLVKPLASTFGRKTLQEIERDDVVSYRTERLKSVTSRTVNHEMSALKRIYSVAMDKYSARKYPDLHISGVEISRIEDYKETAKDRWLTMAEIKTVWNNLASLPDSYARILKVILLTGQRPEEVTGMESDVIHESWWTIPANRSKNGIATRVWVTAETAKYIGFKPVKRNSVSSLLLDEYNATGKVLGVDKFTPHDLRRSMATHLAALNISDEVIDSILNHAKQGVIKVYNQFKYDEQKKSALELWSKKLNEYLAGEAGKVIQLHHAEVVPTDEFMTSRTFSNAA